MRLVRSSVPGAVERDQAIRLLAERAVLTRMVCCELRDADIGDNCRRPQIALFQLLRWINENLGKFVRIEARGDEGIDQMVVPAGCEQLVVEIRAGAQVCCALFMLFTADTSVQAEGDRAVIRKRLAAYWSLHPLPVAIGR